MHDLSVTVIQDVQNWHNPQANRDMYDEHINSIVNTDLIVLPEMFSSGFSMSPQDCHETMDGETIAWMKTTAKKKLAVVAGSLAIKISDGNFVNRLVWAQPDGALLNCIEK